MTFAGILKRAHRTLSQPTEPALRLMMLLGFALLVVARLPEVLLKGRFWAEEGNKFFVFGWSLPWWRALLSPWGGYLNLTANLGGVLAWHAVPLTAAPYATSLLALLIQLCPAILLLTSRLDWLRRPPVLVAALLLVLAVPVSEEVWLSSIGSQVHLSLCAAIILALETSGRAASAFRLFLLALAALSGPGSWLLAPLFVGRAIVDRSSGRAVQAGVLIAAVVLQMSFFYSHEPDRFYAIRPIMFLDLAFEKHVLLALLGPEKIAHIASVLQARSEAGHPPLGYAFAAISIIMATLAAVSRHWRSEAFWLLLAAATLIGVSYAGALGSVTGMFAMGVAGRYVYAPQVLISLAVLAIAATRRDAAGWVCTILAAWLVTTGLIYYFLPSSNFADGPAFRPELEHHLRDHRYRIHSWPPSWMVRMPDDDPPVAS